MRTDGKKPSRLGRYLMGMVRVATLVVVAFAALVYVDYRVARATVFEHLLGMGQRMAPYLGDLKTTEAPREIRINGARFFVAAGQTEHPPELVRNFYKVRYGAKGNPGGSAVDDLARDLERRHALPTGLVDSRAFEFGDADRGGVASLEWAPHGPGMKGFVDGMKKLVATGDVGDMARLRYCYTEKTESGGTRFLTVWTDDSFNLYSIVPKKGGDAPGFDLSDVPRYPGSTRIVSMQEAGMAQRVVVYDGPGSPMTGMMFYRARMKTLGWDEDPSFADVAAKKGDTGLRFMRDGGREVFMTLSDSKNGQGLSTVIVEAR